MSHQNNWPNTDCSGTTGRAMLKDIVLRALAVDEWDTIYWAATCIYHTQPNSQPTNPGMPNPVGDACVHVANALNAASLPTPNWATCRRELNHGSGGPEG